MTSPTRTTGWSSPAAPDAAAPARPSVALRPVAVADARVLAALYRAQRAFLAPFDPLRAEDFYSEEGQRARLREAEAQARAGAGQRFVILADGEPVGTIALSNVVRGALHGANLGYWVAREHNGRGIATAAVARAVAWAFDEAGLHRVEAGTLVENAASQRVLRRNGFRLVGLARGYLHIAGAWRDHLLFERTAGEPDPAGGAERAAGARYDRIGRTYTATRRTEPRIQAAIEQALGDARSVVNVGAGTGAYEPAQRAVLAVEPSAGMLAQRPPDAAPAIRAAAEELPLADRSVDAAMAVLTVHHWSDPGLGLRELRRVARGPVVVLTWDPARAEDFWLTRDYLPELIAVDRRRCPPLAAYAAWLGPPEVRPVPVPADCADGFLAAFWRRPEAYLDPAVRAGISTFAALPEPVVAAAMARLADDLAAGRWHERHRDLLGRDELDLGYRLLVWRA